MSNDVANLVLRVDALEVKAADKDLKSLNKTSAKTDKATGQMTKGFSSMNSVLRLMGPLLSALSVASIANNMLRVARETETYTAQLRTMTGSLESAGIAFERLNEFAKETPFTLKESIDGFVKLKALGLDPSERAMMSYGNTASAMGKSMQDMIEAVADASVGEMERLKEFGIKAKQQGDQVTFTFQGVETTIQKSSENIQKYLMDIGETQFAGAMANQMDTVDGQVSNLKQSFDDLWRTMGDGVSTSSNIKTALESLALALNTLTKSYKEMFTMQNKQRQADLQTEWIKLTKGIKENTAWMERNAWAHGVTKKAVELTAEALGEKEARLAEVNKELEILDVTLGEVADGEDELTNIVGDADGAYLVYLETLKKVKATKKDIVKIEPCEAIKRELSCMDNLIAKYVPLADSVNRHNQQMNELNFIYSEGKVSSEQYADAVKKINDSFNGISDDVEDAVKETKTFTREADPFYTAWENAFTRLDTAGSEFWENLFSGAENSLDSIENLLTSWLAEMAHSLLTKPLMMNIQSSVLGTGSAGGVAGMAGTASSATNIFSAGKTLWDGFTTASGAFGAFGSGAAGTAITPAINAAIGGGALGGFATATGVPLAAGVMGPMVPGAAGAATLAGTGALGAVGVAMPYVAAVVAIASALGAFDSSSDTTPDLNYTGYRKSNVGASTDPVNVMWYGGDDEDGGFDPNIGISGAFNALTLSTQHDAFSSTQQVDEFANSIAAGFVPLENAIYEALGESVSASVFNAMGAFNTGEIKVEEFSGAGDMDSFFKQLISQVFKGIGKNADAEVARYESVYKAAFGLYDNLDVAVGKFVSLKGIVDSDTDRSFNNINNMLDSFATRVGTAEQQLMEFAAVGQLINLESLSDDFKEFMVDVDAMVESGNISNTAVEILTLGVNLMSVNAILGNTNQAIFDFNITGAKLAESLIVGAGGLEAFNSKMGFFYSNFYTEQERTQDVLNSTTETIAEFNEKYGTSVFDKDSLRESMEAMDLTTESGQELYNAMLNLNPAMVQNADALEYMQDEADAASEATRLAADSARIASEAIAKAAEESAEAARIAATAFSDAMITAMTDINEMIFSSAEQWQLDTFSDQEKSDYFSTRADADFVALQNATSVEDITRLTESIIGYGDKMWALLDDVGKQENLDQFLQSAQDVELSAEQRLNLTAEESGMIDFESMRIYSEQSAEAASAFKSASEIIREAAQVISAAAATSLVAAKTEKKIDVTVETAISEVGY